MNAGYNVVAQKKVQKAARKTTPEFPVIVVRLKTLRLMAQLFAQEQAESSRDPKYRSNIFGSLELGS